MWQPRLSKLDFYRRGYLVRNQHWSELPLCLSSTRYPALVQSRGSPQAPAVGYHWPNSQTGNPLYSRVWSLDKYCVPCSYRYTYSYCSVQYSRFMVLIVGTSQVRSRGTEPLASLKILRANPLATILDGCASRIVSIMLQVRIHDGEMA